MFDCWTMLREMDDFEAVAETYRQVAAMELEYRGLDIPISDVLLDTIMSCLCIMGRGSIRPDDYKGFLTGINAIQGHVFRGKINGENASLMTCEVMHLAACVLTGNTFQRITDPAAFRDRIYTMRGIKKINYIRNVDPFAYAHLSEAFRLLQEAGYFTESIL